MFSGRQMPVAGCRNDELHAYFRKCINYTAQLREWVRKMSINAQLRICSVPRTWHITDFYMPREHISSCAKGQQTILVIGHEYKGQHSF
jgi:hypothetical protein